MGSCRLRLATTSAWGVADRIGYLPGGEAVAVGLRPSGRAACFATGCHPSTSRPGLHIALLLCDPLERLQALRPPPRPARLVRQRRAYESCARRAPATACLCDGDGGAPLLEGAYSLWVRELLRALPAEQIRVVLTEDLQRRPAEVQAALHDFLDLPPSQDHDRDLKASLWARPAARTTRLPAATRANLREFYAGFNEELTHFMDGDPRFLWRKG